MSLRKKEDKKSLIDDLSKRILKLKFKSNQSIKSRRLNWVVEKILPTIKGMKNAQSKIKPIKTVQKIGTTYWLECKDYIHNFKAQEVEMTNKELREKSNWVVWWSSKSRFLKQKHSNKK